MEISASGPGDAAPPPPGQPVTTRRRLLSAAAAAGAGALTGAAGLYYRDREQEQRRADGATLAARGDATSLRVLWRANTQQKVMALTFDDGPGPELTPGLLEVLREAKVRATFCVVGENVLRHEDLIRANVRAGHELVNHSWTHPDLALLDESDMTKELDRSNELLTRVAGRAPSFIRPPYGRVSGALLQYAGVHGQAVLLWSIRFREPTMSSEQNAQHVLDNLQPGTIVLGHDAGRSDRYIGVNAVPSLIRGARERGYAFVTASEMLELDR